MSLKRLKWILRSSVLLWFCVAPAVIAYAQNTAVRDTRSYKVNRIANAAEVASVKGRPRPQYDPMGARIGSFQFFPFVSETIAFDDNVFATDVGEQSDTLFKTEAGLFIRSGWSRHLLDLEFAATDSAHRDFSSQDVTDYSGTAKWRLDVRRGFNISGTVSLAQSSEELGAADSPVGGAEPTPFKRIDAAINLNKKFNRSIFDIGFSVQDFDYDDVSAIGGGTIDQDARDGRVYASVFRGAYEFSPGYRVFGQVGGNIRDFGDAAALARDSEGFSLSGGLAIELTHLLAGELSVGYFEQTYDNSLEDAEGFNFKVAGVWNPTMLMTVTLDSGRRISETNFAAASGHVDTFANARIDYEVLRHLIASPFLGIVAEDFQGDPREDKTLTAGLTVEYLINRRLSAGARYEFTSRDSNDDSFDYDRSETEATLKLQF